MWLYILWEEGNCHCGFHGVFSSTKKAGKYRDALLKERFKNAEHPLEKIAEHKPGFGIEHVRVNRKFKLRD